MTLTEARNELRRLELCRTMSTRFLGAQIALETARVARLREYLTLEYDQVYLLTVDPDDEETDETRLGRVDSLRCWNNAKRLCPALLDALDAMRRQYDADCEMVTADRAGWEAEYASTRGV